MGDTANAMAKDGVKKINATYEIRHSHARLDRTFLRDCQIQGRQAHILVGVAGDP